MVGSWRRRCDARAKHTSARKGSSRLARRLWLLPQLGRSRQAPLLPSRRPQHRAQDRPHPSRHPSPPCSPKVGDPSNLPHVTSAVGDERICIE
jgi:hypothetical protein